MEIREISPDLHREYVGAVSGSFLQTPEWGQVKAGWLASSIGWFDGPELVGTGLLLRRPIPIIKRYLVYLPEGPVLPWLAAASEVGRPVRELLDPLISYAKGIGAFAVKIGPQVALRRWEAETVKAAVADPSSSRLGDVAPDWIDPRAVAFVADLRAAGWTQDGSDGNGFGDVQPRFVFQVPLADRTLDDVFAGFNQQWRRNVRKAHKAGVEVTIGTPEDLADFHRVYVETAARDGFTARGLAYFERMFAVMNAQSPDRVRLFLARHDGEVHAATTLVTVGRHAWYSYGASTTAGRDLRPSNAIQWAMIRAAHASGCDTYDLRGITDTVDPEAPLYGLIGFKLGTGGYAQEYVGEWDHVLSPLLARAVSAYLSR